MAKKLTSTKARKILHDKEVHGHPLTEKQRKFFGAIAGGAEPYKAQIGTMLTSLPSNWMDRLSDALAFPQKAITQLFTGEYQTPSQAMGITNPIGAFATDAILDPMNLLLGAGFAKAAKAAPKVSKVATKPKVTPILSQEEAVRARAQRMLEQESKWRGQDNPTLRNKFETAVERHNPASDYPAERIGANTGEATQISRHANLSDANKARMAAHEVGHYYHNAVEEANAWNKYFDWSVLDNLGIEKIHRTRQYLTGSKPSLMSHYPGQTSPSGVLNQWKPKGVPSGDELRERAAQLKDYIAYKNNIPLHKDFKITRSQLDDALKSYVKETGLDNNMTPFLEALKKKGNIIGFLKEMNKRPLVIAPAVLAGAETIEQKQDGGWLDKYEEGGVLKQKTHDNYGTKPNANNSEVSLPPGFVGMAYNTKGRNYSPAWGGQFQDGGVLQPPMAGAPQAMPLMQMGGSLPGAVGFMYARTINPAPANGPYAKKTKASAQDGEEVMKGREYVEQWMNSPMYKQMLEKSAQGPELERISKGRIASFNVPTNVSRDINLEGTGTLGQTQHRVRTILNATGPEYEEMMKIMQKTIDNPKDKEAKRRAEEVMQPIITGWNIGLNPKLKPGTIDYESTLAHEYGHTTDNPFISKFPYQMSRKEAINLDTQTYIPKSDIEKMKAYSQGKVNDDLTKYISKPQETRQYLNDIRYLGKSQGVYDPFSEKITPEQYKRIKPTEFNDPAGTLRNIYTDEQIIDMLNSISKKQNVSDKVPIAQNGEKVAKEWLKNWYEERKTLPEFENIASKRIEALEKVPAVQLEPAPEMRKRGMLAAYIPAKKSIIAADPSTMMEGYDPELGVSPYVLGHEMIHALDYMAPQSGRDVPPYPKVDFVSEKASGMSKPEYSWITSGAIPGTKTEVNAVLYGLRQAEGLKGNKPTTPDQMKSIIDKYKNLGEKELNPKTKEGTMNLQIKNLLDVIGNDPEKLSELNNRIVKGKGKAATTAQDGKKLSYSQWKKQYNLKETPDYNLKRAWELGYTPDKTGHLPTVDNQTGQFLKAKGHPTLQLELDWYNSPEAADFRSKNAIDSSGKFFKYVPKGQDGQEMTYTWDPMGSAGDQYMLKRTVTPYTSKRDIRRFTQAPTDPGQVNFISNYAGAIGDPSSEGFKYPTSVPFKGEKHWNIDRFIIEPAFSNVSEDLQNRQSTKKEMKQNVLADMYKYFMVQNQGDKKDAWKQAKQFVRKEINPRIKGSFYDAYLRGNDMPLTGLGMGITDAITPQYMSSVNRMIEEAATGDGDFASRRYAQNPVSPSKYKKFGMDWLMNYKGLSRKEAKDYLKKSETLQDGGSMKYYQEGLDFKPKTISQDGVAIDPMGYWNPENWGNPVIIPSTDITMEGVDQPLLGISDTGDVQYMEPGEDYEFDGEYVTEYPVMQQGGRTPLYVSDPNDSRLKTYQDSLYNYNVGRRLAGILDADKNLMKVKPGSPYDKAVQTGLKTSGYNLKDNTKKDTGGYKNYERVASIMKEYQTKGNKGILPIRIQSYFPNPDNTVIDIITGRAALNLLGITSSRPPGASHLPQWKKPEQQVILDPSKAPKKTTTQSKPKPKPKPPVKKELPKVETKQQEVVNKPEPVVEKKAPLTDYFQGTPVYAPTPYHGSGAGAFVGYRTPQGDTVFVKPEDYERMGVPKYGREFIESQTKKQRNGGNLSIAQRGTNVPAATTADSLNVYNNAMLLKSFYDKLAPYYGSIKKLPFAGSYKKELESGKTQQQTLAHKDVSDKNKAIIRANKDPNISYVSDVVTGAIDPAAPLAIYDKRISPSSFISYHPADPIEDNPELKGKNIEYGDYGDIWYYATTYEKSKTDPARVQRFKNLMKKYGLNEQRVVKKIQEMEGNLKHLPGNITKIPYYEPLAVKPYYMRTPQEKIEWEKKYGKKEKPKAKPTPPPAKKKVVTPTPEPVKETKAPAPEPVRQTTTPPAVTAPSFTPPIVPSGSVGVFGPGRSRIGEYDEKTNTFYPDYGNLAARSKANQVDTDLISDEKGLADYVASKTGKKPKIDVTLAKQRNGGVNNADAQPLKKLDQLLNFTNYNKPTKGGWLDKYQ